MDTPSHEMTAQDWDLSYLDDLPPITLGEEPGILSAELNADFEQLLEDTTWVDQLEQQVAEPNYTQFESWIPDFERPAKPCDYCRSKHLDCYFHKGSTDCHPCKSLFRECSLNSTTMEATNYASNASGTFFDALHSVNEDAPQEQGSRTTIKFLKSKGINYDAQTDDAPGSSRRNGIRFPQAAVKTLRDWYYAHQDHPYPTEDQKAQLEALTSLKPHQIANWLANQRRKSKVMAKTRPRRCTSPSARPATPAIDIISPDDKPWQEQNPLERWQNSPPENEPADFGDIANAVAGSDLPDGASTPSSLSTRRLKGSSNGSGFSGHPASTTSAETSHGSSFSASSSAAHSGSSRGSFGSFSSGLAGKKDRKRRKRNVLLRQSTDDRRRTFQCTFCTDTFKSKYDWTRHEKSLHLSLEKYICAPIGPAVIDTANGDKVCVYCGQHNPDAGHEEKHNHHACEEKGLDSRTFYRKDHLRQHLRLMHGCELTPNMDAWKFTTSNINSRCGFCAQRFCLWQDRVDHLTNHFRAGTRMIDWKGCRGLDPAVAAQVTNAMPPYLIGIESLSPNPFSATNESSMREFDDGPCEQDEVCENRRTSRERSSDDLPPKASCWEILTIRLGQFANETIAKGTVLTDDMLQTQARHILYGEDDTWNQTAADNPEWLDLFKKGHGLDLIPSRVGGQGQKVPEDLEWYSDLGVRIPFFVQLEQYNKMQNDEALKSGTGGRARLETETSVMMRDIYTQLLAEGVLHSAHVNCPHLACSKNVVECHFMTADQGLRRRQHRWCNDVVVPSNAGLLAKFIGLARSDVPIAPLEQSISAEDGISSRQAGKARATCLERLQWGEVACCPFLKEIKVLGDRRDAQVAQQTLLVASKHQCQNDSECQAVQRQQILRAEGLEYMPYHRAEMPADKAVNFATITGPRTDSGIMSPTISTCAAALAPATGFSQEEIASILAMPTAGTDHSMLDFNEAVLDDIAFEQMMTTDFEAPALSATSVGGLTVMTRLSNVESQDMQFEDIFDADLMS